MKCYTSEQLVFTDESAFDSRMLNRYLGYARINQKAVVYQHFRRGQRHSLVPAISLTKGLFAIKITKENMTQERFLSYVQDYIIPGMRPFPRYNSVLVLDNASVHKGPEVRELLESHGESIRRRQTEPEARLRYGHRMDDLWGGSDNSSMADRKVPILRRYETRAPSTILSGLQSY